MTADDIMHRHIEAKGGADRWRAVTSMEITGTLLSFSEPTPFRLVRVRPDRFRLEQTVLKLPVVLVHDGTTSWWINGLAGNTWPLPAPGDNAGMIKSQAEFAPPLIAAHENGHSVELQGQEEFEGRRAWKLKLTREGGGEETWYLDPKSYLEIASISSTIDFGQSMEKRSYYTDFRKAGGLVMPFNVETEYGQRNDTFRIEEVKTGVAVDEAIFKLPPPPGMELLLPMVGSWDLKVETRPNPRVPWEAKQSSSTITAMLDNGLLVESYSVEQGGATVETLRSWSYDLFRKVYRVVEADNYSFMQNVMEGAMTDGRLTVDNIKTGTTLQVQDQALHMRLVAYEITPDGFKLDAEVSRDAGKTWRTDTRYTYTRK